LMIGGNCEIQVSRIDPLAPIFLWLILGGGIPKSPRLIGEKLTLSESEHAVIPGESKA
jgi:hypothetical protein